MGTANWRVPCTGAPPPWSCPVTHHACMTMTCIGTGIEWSCRPQLAKVERTRTVLRCCGPTARCDRLPYRTCGFLLVKATYVTKCQLGTAEVTKLAAQSAQGRFGKRLRGDVASTVRQRAEFAHTVKRRRAQAECCSFSTCRCTRCCPRSALLALVGRHKLVHPHRGSVTTAESPTPTGSPTAATGNPPQPTETRLCPNFVTFS